MKFRQLSCLSTYQCQVPAHLPKPLWPVSDRLSVACNAAAFESTLHQDLVLLNISM
jgi:hypothetical protein